MIWSDEIYEKFVYDDVKHVSPASLPNLKGRVITMGAASKTYAMTGWRLGWVATPAEYFQPIRELHACTTTAASSISQYAALAALTGPQGSINEMVSEYRRRRDYTVKRLNEMAGVAVGRPKGTFYVFPDISAHTLDDVEFARELLREAHVQTVPGSGFGENGRGHLRISFATPPKALEEGLTRMEKFTRKLDSRAIHVASPRSE
jgi:aspartate/methionine/tyrosine aminotransferase